MRRRDGSLRKGCCKDMKILAPVCSIKEVEALAACGVDEVYCGVLSRRWVSKFSHLASINRVDRLNGSLQDYGQLQELVSAAHRHGVKVNLALNGLYTDKQADLLQEELKEILRVNIDGMIVADIGVVSLLKKSGAAVKIHASTGLTVFNSESVSFLKEEGIDRIVLPRSLEKEEIRKMVQSHPVVEFEVFIMNGRCKNIDGFCTFQHGLSDLNAPRWNRFLISSRFGRMLQDYVVQMPSGLRKAAMSLAGNSVCSTACSLDYQVNVMGEKGLVPHSNFSGDDFLEDMYRCGGCSVLDFFDWGVHAIKIVGRTFPLERKVQDVSYLKKLIRLAGNSSESRAVFRKEARKLYQEIYGAACRGNCYYQENPS